MKKTRGKTQTNLLLVGILPIILFSLLGFLFTQPVFGNDQERANQIETPSAVVLKLTRG